MNELARAMKSDNGYMARPITRNGIEWQHRKALFLYLTARGIRSLGGRASIVRADLVVIATGSRPRTSQSIPADHENILDRDSILSVNYLPESPAVPSDGSNTSEYAFLLARLGVSATMIDRSHRPVRFLEEEIATNFARAFEHDAGPYLDGRSIESVAQDGLSHVVTTLVDREVL